jgi:hypothetical protein
MSRHHFACHTFVAWADAFPDKSGPTGFIREEAGSFIAFRRQKCRLPG